MNCTRPDVIDYSHQDYGAEPKILKTLDVVDGTKIALITFVMAGTLLGNTSVIIFVLTLRKSLRKSFDIYMANLAVADLMVCVVCMTTFLSQTVQTEFVFTLGSAMCKLSPFCQVTFLMASVLTVAALSCGRCIDIISFSRVNDKKKTKVFLVAVWILSIAVSTPLLFFKKLYIVRFSNFEHPACGAQWPRSWDEDSQKCVDLKWVPKLYYTMISVMLFFLPVTVMIVTNRIILRRLQFSLPGARVQRNENIRMRRKQKTRMVFVVLLAFAICWMPFHSVVLYDQYTTAVVHPDWFVEVFRAAEFLAYCNSLVNPVIYGIFTKSFRQKIRLLLLCKSQGQPNIIRRVLTLTTSLTTTSKSSAKRKGKVILERNISTVPCENIPVPMETMNTIRHGQPVGNEANAEDKHLGNETDPKKHVAVKNENEVLSEITASRN